MKFDVPIPADWSRCEACPPGEVHDPGVLEIARTLLMEAPSGRARAALIRDAVARDAAFHRRCLNLVAAEAPASEGVRALLSAEVGCRAAGGNIGPGNRVFPGLDAVDELEALCLELLKG